MSITVFRSSSPDSENQSYLIRTSYARRIERGIVRAWKTMTIATRKSQRASFVPNGFVMVNKRRSIMPAY
ncbi:hypothetical protein E1B28_007699 [Marasmius oreades]|uniref:Uncharacterized protein n=1 Tax=Marasmius oreades TaxID=181124 RepID=A0A9P7S2H1_9AGAR|nr:uncharacterized protein E1B28_007699 [Marasmius oreades]KAG7094080.1 hypothetical protein E1B28_007699 [Marasmius oreades]